MLSRLFHILNLLVLLESSGAHLVSEGVDGAVRQGSGAAPAMEQRVFTQDSATRDVVSVNMFKLYEKYSKEPQSQREGNTVRSFKALPSEWPHAFISSTAKVKGINWASSSIKRSVSLSNISLTGQDCDLVTS